MTIKQVEFIAYMDKNTEEIGTLRLVKEGEDARNLAMFMKQELHNRIEGAKNLLKRDDLNKDLIKDLETEINYCENLAIAIITAKDFLVKTKIS